MSLLDGRRDKGALGEVFCMDPNPIPETYVPMTYHLPKCPTSKYQQHIADCVSTRIWAGVGGGGHKHSGCGRAECLKYVYFFSPSLEQEFLLHFLSTLHVHVVFFTIVIFSILANNCPIMFSVTCSPRCVLIGDAN